MNNPSAVNNGMLESLRIRNFRVFEELFVEKLNRVNLVTGRNNTGKTSFLEVLFVLSGGGNPGLMLNSNVIRRIDLEKLSSSTAIEETLWKPMFFTLDTGRCIEIEGTHSLHGNLVLCISLKRPSVTEITLDRSSEMSARNTDSGTVLSLSFKVGQEPGIESHVHLRTGNIQFSHADRTVPFITCILSTQITTLQEDATRLGQLRKQKRVDILLNALRIIEPRLQSVEDNSASGIPLIWGDIGLSELVPLATMGEGMTRIARLVLAISAAPGGLVLVDEIETGLHHSVLPDVWRAVDAAARQFDTQVVATTHSFECVQAAGQALGAGDGLLLHRLEASESGNRCVTYGPEDLDAAIRHGLEVR